MFKGDQTADDMRNKNIRQTELLVDLREAVLQVGRHFQVMNQYFGCYKSFESYLLYTPILIYYIISIFPFLFSFTICVIMFVSAMMEYAEKVGGRMRKGNPWGCEYVSVAIVEKEKRKGRKGIRKHIMIC